MKTAVIVDSVRTGLAKSFRGGFNQTRADDMTAHLVNALLERNPGLDPSLVEDKFGYDVPGYMMGGIANFAPGGSVFGPMMLSNPTLMPGSDINIPNIESGKDIDFSDVFDKDAQDEAQEDLDEINEEEENGLLSEKNIKPQE